jgi:hypothetical protein
MLTYLQEYQGALNFATDAWTSPNHKAFVAVTVHFENNGVLICMLLDIVEVAKSHSGANLAAAFAHIINEFGISDKVSIQKMLLEYETYTRFPKVLSITCDNALCNDMIITELANLLANFPGQANQTRCFLHIINLVAKSIIWQFDVIKGKADKALNEAEEVLHALADGLDLEDLETQIEREGDDGDDDNDNNIDGWVNERNALSMADCEALDASICPVKLVLVKVNS